MGDLKIRLALELAPLKGGLNPMAICYCLHVNALAPLGGLGGREKWSGGD